jgi:hypothetical protein
VDALVGTQPDIALVAFCHTGDAQFSSTHLFRFQSSTVEGYHVKTVVGNTHEHLTRTGDE